MFSGIIATTGSIKEIKKHEDGKIIVISSSIDQTDFKIGDSIAVSGCCLTITARNGRDITFYASADTLKKTNLSMLSVGSSVNLEPALKLGERLGGHLVSGHVDETARVIGIETAGADRKIKIEISHYGKNLAVQRGSICVDGVSLTIAYITGNIISLNIIPHTWETTTLKHLNPQTHFLVNIEYDGIAKHVYKIVKSIIAR
jgi:riboflavin synthase